MDELDEGREVEVLDRAACLTLLGTAALGRIAFTEGALPAVQPVTFALGDGELYIPTHAGSKVAAASRGAVVAFEVDDVDPLARTGWNVTVVGPSRLIVDSDDVARLDAMGVRPWARSGAGHCYIGVRTQLVQGRRIASGAASSAVLSA
ncbi:pyridoxamine 5'-phosphate oxidase family protein [Modestobacter sp. SSW1-42]|uniref:pyridoxamine 5'-phosphate oxidase family protein n=1 Tax=Modestobacter sp. SSW1-42 TaxID=596372 RepID=UPI003986F64C